jgi:hypothetical protein
MPLDLDDLIAVSQNLRHRLERLAGFFVDENNTLALISTRTPRSFCMTRTCPSSTRGANAATISRAIRCNFSCCLSFASAKRLAFSLRASSFAAGSAGAGASMRCGTGSGATMSGLRRSASFVNAVMSEFVILRYLPSLTWEIAYITAKTASSSVMKSA